MVSAPILVPCPRCLGAGYDPEASETTYSWECCGDVLPSGECCAAVYGTGRLIAVPQEEPVACHQCGGYGEVESGAAQPKGDAR